MHRNRATRARDGLIIAASFWLGCASNDDVVATEVDVVPPSSSAERLIVVDPGVPAGVIAGGSTQAGGVPSGGSSMLSAPGGSLAPSPPFSLPDGALLVSGSPRPIPSEDAVLWPFPELLRDVFGLPTPNAPVEPRIEADPIRADVLRRLGDDYGFEPGVAAAMLVVVDGVDDQYDITIWEP
jgi:hypothetical protein